MKQKRNKKAMHPRNKYAEAPPDFSLLASLYPSFKEHVSYAMDGRARIDWTDFNATRELTRVLLEHDYGIKWWIPNGHLCPTVPNRANYIHWIEDLLDSCPASWHKSDIEKVVGIDIGTGANCIYPLLGAALHGWHFVGTDITDTAFVWAQKNICENAHLSDLIEIRKVDCAEARNNVEMTTVVVDNGRSKESYDHDPQRGSDIFPVASLAVQADMVHTEKPLSLVFEHLQKTQGAENLLAQLKYTDFNKSKSKKYEGPYVLAGVVKDWERFDFCMCNPPFFESIEEAGLNPRTACGGTIEEMVCSGGEQGFIMQMIEDSVHLRQKIHWYTTMVGRKVNLKVLIPKLWKIGVTMVRTTEFCQGRTSRWGLAWSFTQVKKDSFHQHVSEKTRVSFMLEGLPRQSRANDVLQALAHHLRKSGAACKVDVSSFSLTGTLPDELTEKETSDEQPKKRPKEACHGEEVAAMPVNQEKRFSDTHGDVHFSSLVFEQAPGALLVKGSLLEAKKNLAGAFSAMFDSVEQALKQQFCLKSHHQR